jgi:hypothetical protein
MSLAPTQNLDDRPTPVIPFQPETEAEEVTANIIRMMLKFELARVQLETPDLIDLSENERITLRQEATKTRINGFNAQNAALASGVPATYDDDFLRREGVRMAYFLARGAKNQARLIEEETITIAVNKALYNIDDDRITIDLELLAA